MLDLPEHQSSDLRSDATAEYTFPAWLAADPCPSWCAGDHPLDEHLEDRAHISPLLDVPVIAKGEFRGGCDVAVPAEYVVTMRRYAGAAETWVCIGDGLNGAHRLDITAESARRLLAKAAELVGEAFA